MIAVVFVLCGGRKMFNRTYIISASGIAFTTTNSMPFLYDSLSPSFGARKAVVYDCSIFCGPSLYLSHTNAFKKAKGDAKTFRQQIARSSMR